MKAIICCFLVVSVLSCEKGDVSIDEEETNWIVEEKDPLTSLVITVDDILSFNLASREIVFNDSIVCQLADANNLPDKLILYLDEDLLLEMAIIASTSSLIYNDLVIEASYFEEREPLFYLEDGYPLLQGAWSAELKESTQKERQENAQKRQAAWDTFIVYLSDAGKIAYCTCG